MKSTSFKTHFQMITEFYKNNKLIFGIWMIIIITLFTFMDLNINKRLEGFASIESINVNFNQHVTIKNIYKQVGESVEAGSLLLLLENKELNVELSRKKTEIKILEKKIHDANELKDKNLAQILKEDLSHLYKEYEILNNKYKELSVYAEYDCIISNINYSIGEYVPAFSDILTLQKSETNLVNAFVSEYEQNDYQPGQKVVVESLDHQRRVKGEIVQTSSEISQAPERLNEVSISKEWGSKLVIRLNKPIFKRGEKLIIQPLGSSNEVSFFNNVQARIQDKKDYDIIKKAKYELSAIKKLNDNIFLIAGDEGDKIEKSIFIYNIRTNKIEDINVDKNVDIEDVESIFIKGDDVYIVASHSKTKENNRKDNREKIVHLRYINGNSFVFIAEIKILKDMKKLLKEQLDLDKEDLKDFEIEATDIFDDNVFIGLKSPIKNNIIMIKVSLIDLENEVLTNAQSFLVPLPSKNYNLTSIKFLQSEEVILTLNKDEKSEIYKSNIDFSSLKKFDKIDKKVEGLELYKNNLILMIDNSKKPGEILRKEYE